MNEHRSEKISSRKGTERAQSSCTRMRVVAVFCAVLLCLMSLVGCATSSASDELSAIRAELSEALLEIDALESKYGAAEQEIDALESRNTAAEEEIDALESRNTAAEEEIDALESRNTAAEEEIDALESRNTAAEEEIDALESQNTAAEAEISKLEDEIKELENSISGKIRIYIDQGHNPTGYHNSGATGNGLYEQDLTFLIGYMLAELLEKDARFEVCLSRPTEDTVLGTDNDSSLDARVRGAAAWGADYFISLHTNAADSVEANGIEVLVASEGGVSYAFGSKLLAGILESTDLTDRGMKLRPELRVLKNAAMPAALVEMGFITNADDAAKLSQNPALFAQGLYAGILEYFCLPPYDAFADEAL